MLGQAAPAGPRGAAARCAMAQLYMEYAHGLRGAGCGRMGPSIRILPESIAHTYYRYDRRVIVVLRVSARVGECEVK